MNIKEKVSLLVSPFPLPVNGNWLRGAALRFWLKGHELETKHLIERVVTKDMRVADVGAHIGAHTATLVDLAKEVYAFEPDKKTRQYLTKNVPAAKVLPYVVGAEDGEVSFDDTKRGQSHVSQQGRSAIKQVVLRNYGHFDFVKIDAEGYDLEVIKGLDTSKTVHLTVEFSPKSYDAKTFLAQLKTLGVRYYFIESNGSYTALPDSELTNRARAEGHINLYGIIGGE